MKLIRNIENQIEVATRSYFWTIILKRNDIQIWTPEYLSQQLLIISRKAIRLTIRYNVKNSRLLYDCQ